MYDVELVIDSLQNMENALSLVVGQTENIVSIDNFLLSPTGMLMLDGVCMNLLAVGESVKVLDKRTNGELLIRYPYIPWKDIMKMRDVIAHHYFDVDAEKVFSILRNDVPPLLRAIKQIKQDLYSSRD